MACIKNISAGWKILNTLEISQFKTYLDYAALNPPVSVTNLPPQAAPRAVPAIAAATRSTTEEKCDYVGPSSPPVPFPVLDTAVRAGTKYQDRYLNRRYWVSDNVQHSISGNINDESFRAEARKILAKENPTVVDRTTRDWVYLTAVEIEALRTRIDEWEACRGMGGPPLHASGQMMPGRRYLFSRRRCDSPVLIRLLKEIYKANGVDLVVT